MSYPPPTSSKNVLSWVLLAALLVGGVCFILAGLQPTPVPLVPPKPPINAKICLIKDVKAIAGTPRPAGSEANRRARQYIITELRKLGLEIQQQQFSSGVNVIATQKGASDKTIIIGAHYDTVSSSPGADDNASGTAMTLLLARQLSRKPMQHTVRYVLFDNEESGLIGSSYYARNMSEKCIFMLNSDMVGTLNANTESPDSVFSEAFQQYPWARSIIHRDSRGASDHSPFTSRSIPTVFIHTGIHSRYHRPSDTPDTLNYKGMVKINEFLLYLVQLLDKDPMQAKPFVDSLPAKQYQP